MHLERDSPIECYGSKRICHPFSLSNNTVQLSQTVSLSTGLTEPSTNIGNGQGNGTPSQSNSNTQELQLRLSISSPKLLEMLEVCEKLQAGRNQKLAPVMHFWRAQRKKKS